MLLSIFCKKTLLKQLNGGNYYENGKKFSEQNIRIRIPN